MPLAREYTRRYCHQPKYEEREPEEIAFAIASEVAAVLSSRHGGFLRERKSGVHATIAVAGGAAA